MQTLQSCVVMYHRKWGHSNYIIFMLDYSWLNLAIWLVSCKCSKSCSVIHWQWSLQSDWCFRIHTLHLRRGGWLVRKCMLGSNGLSMASGWITWNPYWLVGIASFFLLLTIDMQYHSHKGIHTYLLKDHAKRDDTHFITNQMTIIILFSSLSFTSAVLLPHPNSLLSPFLSAFTPS